MATSAQINSIVALYAGYFDRAPDPAGLQFWIAQIDAGRDFATIAADFAKSAEATGLYPFLTQPDVASPSTFVTAVYQNLFGRAPDAAGLKFWTDVLAAKTVPVGDMIQSIINGAVDAPTATPPTLDATVLANKQTVGLDFATDAANTPGFIYDTAAVSAAKTAMDGVTSDPASVTAAQSATDAFLDGAANLGSTFTLTADQDNIPGTSGNDTVIGLVDGAANTFTLGDYINGGAGTDTVKITTDQADISLSAVTFESVETFYIDSRGTDFGDVDVDSNALSSLAINGNNRVLTDDATIVNIDTSTAISIMNVDANGFDIYPTYNDNNDGFAASMTLQNVDDAEIDINFDVDADGSSDADVFNLTLDGVMNTDGDMDIYGGDIETFNVTVASNSDVEYIGFYFSVKSEFTGNVNLTLNGDLTVADYWDLSDDDTDSLFTITGSGNLDINDLDDSDGDSSVDASAATGNIAIASINDEASFVNTGSGDDEIGLDGSTTTVSLGDGDDTVSVGAALVLDTTGATDVVDADLNGGDGTDTFEISAANALTSENNVAVSTDDLSVLDAISGFEALSLTGNTTQNIDATTWGLGDDVTINGYTVGGSLTVNDAAMVTVTGNGTTDYAIVVDGADAVGSDADSLTVVVDAINGQTANDLTVANVETVNLVSNNDDADESENDTNTVDLIAVDAVTLNITGEATAALVLGATTDLTAVETVDASGFDGDLTVSVATSGEAVTITTGAGDDTITGSDQVDTIDAGAGANSITGGLEADVISLSDAATLNAAGTAGVDVDTIVYGAVADSQGTTVDTITGFQVDVVVGQDAAGDDILLNDVIDLSAITVAGATANAGNTAVYLGEANGYGAVLTSLTGDATNSEAVLDTSTNTLYVDVDADGALTDADMSINLTGVTDLSAVNFIFA